VAKRDVDQPIRRDTDVKKIKSKNIRIRSMLTKVKCTDLGRGLRAIDMKDERTLNLP